MGKLSKEEYFVALAQLVASRGTCVRRKVGCVLTNKHGHVLATGYNGIPMGMVHCLDQPCGEASASASGDDLDKCEAMSRWYSCTIHAEANALLQCRNVYEIDTCYTTTFPCIHCIKLLANTSCKRIVYVNIYPGSEVNKMTKYWEETDYPNRTCIRLNHVEGRIYIWEKERWRRCE